MIKVCVGLKGDFLKKINIKGHAGQSEKGKDLVCAAVSALYFAAVNSLIKYAGEENRDFYIKNQAGDSEIEVVNDLIENQMILKTFLTGLENIKREYKDLLVIEEVNLNGT